MSLGCSFLSHTSDIDDLLEGLDSILKDWFDRLHNTKSSFHIINLWLHTLNSLHLSSDLNKWLSIIKSLEDSSGECLLDVLNGSGLGDGGGLIVSGLGLEGGVEGGSKGGDELGVRHSLEGSLLVDELNVVVMVVVSSGNGGEESGGEFHFDINLFDSPC